jgi:hypothetical protein
MARAKRKERKRRIGRVLSVESCHNPMIADVGTGWKQQKDDKICRCIEKAL